MAEMKRIAHVLNDYNDVITNDFLRDHEILLNYNEKDIIVILDNGEEWSVKKEISDRLAKVLSVDHVKTSNAHPIVTEERNGFMSYSQCILFNKMIKDVTQLQSVIKEHVKLSELNIIKKNINIENNQFEISASVFCGLNFKIEKNIQCPDRPEKDFVNNEGEIGNRKDIILLVFKDNVFDIEYYEDIAILSDYIFINGKYYTVDGDKLISKDNDEVLFSLYILNINNNEYVSDENMNGKISNEISELEIHDITADVDIEKTEYKTNIHQLDYDINAIQIYIPLNGDEYDKKTNQSLNKNISYKNSPFGLMMKNSVYEGNVIDIDKSNQFNFEFLIDNNIIENETLVTFYDSLMTELISIEYDNGFIILKDVVNNTQCKLEKSSERFSYIRVYFNNAMKSAVLNIDEKYSSTLNVNIDISDIKKFQINACKSAIGEILLINGNYTNKYMKNKIKFIESSNHYGNIKVFNKNINFKLSDEIDEFNIDVNKSSNNKLNAGDYITFNFNRKLSPVPFEEFKINDYLGNRIVVNKHNFKTKDMVVIENENEIFITSILAIDETSNEIILEEIPEFNMLHHVIYDVSRNYSYFKLFLKNNPNKVFGNIYKQNGIYTLKLKEELPLDTEFTINFKEIVDDEFIFDEDEKITTVLFNKEKAIKSDMINSTFKKSEVTLTCNNTKVDNNFLRENLNLFTGDTIEIYAGICIADLFSKSSIDKNMLYNITNISADIELSSGSNPVYINDKKYDRGNIISKYRLGKEDINVDLSTLTLYIKISTKKQITEGKLLLKSLNINFSLSNNDNIEIYYVTDMYHRITDYLILNKNLNDIYLNSDKECTIITEKKVKK